MEFDAGEEVGRAAWAGLAFAMADAEEGEDSLDYELTLSLSFSQFLSLGSVDHPNNRYH